MSETKNYEPYKIPPRNSIQGNEFDFISSKTDPAIFFEDQPFTEIEIDSGINTSYEPAPISQSIELVMDEKRKIFNSMREISRYNHSSYFLNSKFYHKQAQYENSKIFYRQAVFMKDFEDDYTEKVPFSSYFPYYQLMGYEQLRTYFTWRTKVRSGNIENTSLSYAFIYIYELLNNVGVNDPVDGLDKLMSFWTAFKIFDTTIEKYLIKWVKDYHIYYELPKSFKEFLCENELQNHYLNIVGYKPKMNFNFEQLCGISKYNIKQSTFYGDKTNQLIIDCFDFTINKLKNIFAGVGIELNDLIFQSSKSKSVWKPFNEALFYPNLKQSDRRVVLCENEVYICSQNNWVLSTLITLESGRQLIGYILKQMEAVLRKVTKYKYKLSANLNTVNGEILQKLGAAGISLEKAVTDAVLEFYREKTKIVVSVNNFVLNRIRLEALDTQEKLIVPENDFQMASISFLEAPPADKEKEKFLLPPADELALPDRWTSLKNALNKTEIEALSAVLQGARNIKQFADENGVMLEVLADSINEKAFDHIGDNILELDDYMMIYDEYREKIMIMVG